MQSQTWFIEMHNLLTDITTNDTIKEATDNEIASFEQQMRAFFSQVKLFQMNHGDEQRQLADATAFSQIYSKLLTRLSLLYVDCPNPEESRGRFDYGKQRKERELQIENVGRLYQFVDDFYIQLVKGTPTLPIPLPPNTQAVAES